MKNRHAQPLPVLALVGRELGHPLAAADITFSTSLTGTYSPAATGSSGSSYVKCNHTTSGITARLIKFVGGATTNSVAALTVWPMKSMPWL